MLKIRRPLGRLIFNMGIAIPGKTVFLIETAPWLLHYVGVLGNILYVSETRLKTQLSWNLVCPYLIIFHLPNGYNIQHKAQCSVQNFKTIRQLKRMLWRNAISRDLNLGWVSGGYSILHSSPGFVLFTHLLLCYHACPCANHWLSGVVVKCLCCLIDIHE